MSMRFFRRFDEQRGAALIVALIFLVALTLLGLASMGNNQLQHRMAYGAAQSTIALQATESALTDGEAWLASRTPKTRPLAECDDLLANGTNCFDQLGVWIGRPPPGTAAQVTLARVQNPGWWTVQGRKYGYNFINDAPTTQRAGQIISGVSAPPRYVVEELGKDPTSCCVVGFPEPPTLWFYQLTARGTGPQTDPPTITQSVFAVLF